jgi:hypothetical protein
MKGSESEVLKIEESESELLCTDSIALLVSSRIISVHKYRPNNK